MAFQDTAGGIVLDATLTDLGRKYMAQGRFKVTKFALGDDEVDYTLGGKSTGEWKLNKDPSAYPTLEASYVGSSVIASGLVDFKRDDIVHLPEYKIAQPKINNAVQEYGQGTIYFSVNTETTTKLKTALDVTSYVLENESQVTNMLICESGIESGSAPVLYGTQETQERFIYNFDLYDKYVFVYCDSRLFDGLLANQPDAYFQNDNTDVLYKNFQPLIECPKTSLSSIIEEQDTYYCATVKNETYDVPESEDGTTRTTNSSFTGPRSNVIALNFIVNPKLSSKSNTQSDLRYTKFGKTKVNLFGDGNLYDFIDTRVTIEGCATTRQKQFTIRILRFSGT